MSLPTNLEDLKGYQNALARDIFDQVKRREKLLTEAAEFKRRAAEYEKQASELQRPGYPGDRGIIPAARAKLAEVSRMIEDFDKPLVYWTKYGSCDQPSATAYPHHHGHAIDVPFIVEKVTAKRIYVRRKGSDNSCQFGHDGSNIGRWKGDQIDLAKTFPQGVKPTGASDG